MFDDDLLAEDGRFEQNVESESNQFPGTTLREYPDIRPLLSTSQDCWNSTKPAP